MNGVVLYNKDECPFCWRVRMALQRAGIDAENRAHDDARWADVWPRLTLHQTVPVLAVDDLVLTDSRVILEFIDESHGYLLPRTAADRARVREMVCFADAQLGPIARALVFECRDKAPHERDPVVIDTAIGDWQRAMQPAARLLTAQGWFGNSCSLGDYAAVTRFALAGAYGMPLDCLPPTLSVWLGNVMQRREVIETAPVVVRQWWDHQSQLEADS